MAPSKSAHQKMEGAPEDYRGDQESQSDGCSDDGSDINEEDHSQSTMDKLGSETGETVDTKSDELITMDETTAVVRSKKVVILLLILTAIVAAALTYVYSKKAETEAFETKFAANVHEIEETVAQRWLTAQAAIANLATSIASATVAAQAQADLPSFHMPFFQAQGQEVMELSSDAALAVGWAPLTPAVAGMTLPIQQLAPADANSLGYDLLASPQVEDLFLHMVAAQEPVQSGLSIPLEFLDLAPEQPHTLMFQPIFKNVTTAMLAEHDGRRRALFLTIIDPADQVENDEEEKVTTTSAPSTPDTTATPFPTTSSTATELLIPALSFSVLSWNLVFQDILAPGSGKMVVILEHSCGQEHNRATYELDEHNATFLGYGDLQQHPYTDSMEHTVWLEPISNNHICKYHLHMFPSQELDEQYHSDMPWIYAMLVALGVCLFLAAFVCYDRFVENRQQKVLSRAARSNAIVASLFPSNVRDRIMKDAQLDVETKLNKRKAGLSSKNQLKDFLMDGGGVEENDTATDSKPIADLFPHTTVLFGDIAGFTAWSSIREPCQVFELLETLYNAFDGIARRRRVFKVETIGDCYVAVCGLPEPRKDHATTMARFARDLISTMSTMTRRLEVTLGPDTGDLAMRIGLHSGPVTAGVLRGQNCRFQLFGDTVNTAARMESNGMRDAIHISDETATLLRDEGKDGWLIPREDKIVAKGKGEMKTWWIKSKKSGPGSVTTSGSSSVASRGSSEGASNTTGGGGPHLPKRIKRLVTFNADLLERILKAVVARRDAELLVRKSAAASLVKFGPSFEGEKSSRTMAVHGGTVLDEVEDIVHLPEFNAKAAMKQQDPKDVELTPDVVKQLHEYVTVLATMYRREVPFHNFEHASHVTMSVSKLLSRIVAPDSVLSSADADPDEVVRKLHDHTYGITSDPMTQFAAVMAALIHDVDHAGVPNAQLVKEGTRLAGVYNNKSVAEQNSIDLAWDLLMDEGFKDLRAVIYTNDTELKHFRQLMVNLVLATDICDKELGAQRKARWAMAFAGNAEDTAQESEATGRDRKATIVLEHLIQASDVAHTMQHWHIYRKWNERFFEENMKAFSEGRSDKDPSAYWYEGELGFFDYYIIPLAKKLKECGVFGVASDEYLIYAEKNRQEWELRGQEVVAEMAAKYLPSLVEEDEELSCHDEDFEVGSDGSGSFDESSALVMDQETIHNVSESWELLRRIPNYEEEAGTILFAVLFEKCPPAKVLFGFPIDMDPNSDALKNSKRFIMHAKYMIQMLDRALELLGPDSEMLADILSELGKKHVRLGVKEAFFPVMGEALMVALGSMLGDKLTEEMKESWAIVYEAFSAEMIKAMNHDKAVLMSWNKLKAMPNYQEHAGVILFQKLFVDCPETKILFGFPADMDVYSDSMLDSRRFKSHAAYFIEMLDKALDMVEAKQIGDNMKRLGAMHATFGVQEAYFPIMGEALFHTLKLTLKGAWNAPTEEAWRDVYGRLASQMIAAMKEEGSVK